MRNLGFSAELFPSHLLVRTRTGIGAASVSPH